MSDESDVSLEYYELGSNLEIIENDSVEDRSEINTHIKLKNIIQSQNDYIKEISKFQDNCKDLNDVESALAYNLKLQKDLRVVHQKIVNMLVKCQLLYEQNESLLNSKSVLNKTKEQTIKRGVKYGAPYFKNQRYEFSTPNDDYLNRKYNLGEFFMFDKEYYDCSPHWIFLDKIKLLNSVKTQAIRYVENKSAINNKLKRNSVYINPATITCKDIMNRVDKNFQIDWESISLFDLSNRHGANQCNAMWNLYLKPLINRSKWTETENVFLHNIVQKYNYENWKAISSEMNNRSEYQCFIHYQTIVASKYSSKFLNSGKWTSEEDNLLLRLVNHFTTGSTTAWNSICSFFGTRTKRQIYCRYRNSIDPEIQKGNFSKIEDFLILAAVEEYGEHFAEMPDRIINGRTKVQLRNRYSNTLKENPVKDGWTLEDDKTLMKWVNCNGTKNWKEFASKIQHHTRIGCRTRYQTIVKYFRKNPNCSIEDIPRRRSACRSKLSKDNWKIEVTELTSDNDLDNILNDSTSKLDVCPDDANVQKLRYQEIDFYELFKYSYNFDFDSEYNLINCNKTNIKLICNILNICPNAQNLNKLHPQIAESLFVNCIENQKTKLTSKTVLNDVPYNYSSLLGVRALWLLANNRIESIASKVIQPRKGRNRKSKRRKQSSKLIDAKEEFCKRFHQLFYQSAVLTRCKIENVTAVSLYYDSEKLDDCHEIDKEIVWNTARRKRKPADSTLESPAKYIKL